MHQLKANAGPLGIGRAQFHWQRLGRSKRWPFGLETDLCSGPAQAVAAAPGSWANADRCTPCQAQHETSGCGLVPGRAPAGGSGSPIAQTIDVAPLKTKAPFPLRRRRTAGGRTRSSATVRMQHQPLKPRRFSVNRSRRRHLCCNCLGWRLSSRTGKLQPAASNNLITLHLLAFAITFNCSGPRRLQAIWPE